MTITVYPAPTTTLAPATAASNPILGQVTVVETSANVQLLAAILTELKILNFQFRENTGLADDLDALRIDPEFASVTTL